MLLRTDSLLRFPSAYRFPVHRRNPPLRAHVEATSGGAALLVLTGLLGPDVLLFACDARLPAVEAALSRAAAQARPPPAHARANPSAPPFTPSERPRYAGFTPSVSLPATAAPSRTTFYSLTSLTFVGQGLRRLAILQHLVHGVPLVVANVLIHSQAAHGGGQAWEEQSLGVLTVSVAALVLGLPWIIVEFSQPRNMLPESLESVATHYPRRGSVC